MKSIFPARNPASNLCRIIVALMLGPIFTGCAAPSVSLQPEIKSTAKGDLGNYERMKAAAYTDEAVSKLSEMNAASHEALGDAMMAQGDFQSAYSHYNKAVEKSAGLDQTRLEYKQGMVFLYAGQYDKAMGCFESIIADAPDYAAAYEGIGRIHLKKGEMEAAKTEFQKAVALNADLWQSQNFLGTIYDNEGDWEQAVSAYESALAVNPREGSVLNNLGISYLLANKNDLAIQAIEMAIQSGFTESRAFNNLGLALARAGRFAEALEAFKEAVGEAAAYNNLGCIHLENGRRQMAIECFEKAMALDSKFYVTASENLKKANMSVNAEMGGTQ